MPNPTTQTQEFTTASQRSDIKNVPLRSKGQMEADTVTIIYHPETKHLIRKPISFWPAICPVAALKEDGIGPLANPMDGTAQNARRNKWEMQREKRKKETHLLACGPNPISLSARLTEASQDAAMQG